jgi:hypothetical protein
MGDLRAKSMVVSAIGCQGMLAVTPKQTSARVDWDSPPRHGTRDKHQPTRPSGFKMELTPMTVLGLILAVKITVTGVLVVAPLLLLSEERLTGMFRLAGDGGTAFLRLYGVALLALLVGYASGFWMIADGRFPSGIVAMGVVSNAGAALVLCLTGAWRHARWLTAFMATIAAALIFAAAFGRQALTPIAAVSRTMSFARRRYEIGTNTFGGTSLLCSYRHTSDMIISRSHQNASGPSLSP